MRAKVGDRYVIAELLERNWLLGGENSGHLVCFQHTTTGDAIIAALQVLMALKRRQQTLVEARSDLKKCPQVLVNVRMAEKVDVSVNARVKAMIEQVEANLGDSGRVLLRPSGTEPVVRVMVEGRDESHVTALADQLAGVVATNTTIERPSENGLYAETGGLSGRPLASRSTKVIRHLYQQTKGAVPLIGVGGIFTEEDAWEKITAGASLLQIYSGLVYEGPQINRAILNGLAKRLANEGLAHIRDAVGIAS